MSIEFLHSMVRVTDIDASLKFYCEGLGLTEVGRYDSEAGRFTLVFLASPADIERCGGIPEGKSPTEMQIPMIELTHNWDPEEYGGGRNFGHLAYRVENIYE
ncbi:MAG: VOC family protein, partial [Hyphomonas sp.]